jgi:hypothetical protein
MTFTKLSLTDTPRALAALGTPVTYRALWGAVVEGRIPAERVGKRWFIRDTDLKSIAQTFTQA